MFVSGTRENNYIGFKTNFPFYAKKKSLWIEPKRRIISEVHVYSTVILCAMFVCTSFIPIYVTVSMFGRIGQVFFFFNYLTQN